MKILENLLTLKRRYIWLATALVFVIPYIFDIKAGTLEITGGAADFYKSIEELPPHSAILLSADIPPSFNAELKPYLDAFLEHAFRKNLNIVALSLYPDAVGSTAAALEQAAKKHGKIYGEDYVYLGWQPSETAVITGILASVRDVFASDYRGAPVSGLALIKKYNKTSDFMLLAQIGSGFDNMPWLSYGADKAAVKYIVAANAGAEGTLRPYYASGQIKGLAVSLKGAAEYEQQLGLNGQALKAMASVSLAQLYLLFIIITVNILLLIKRIFKIGNAGETNA